MICIKSLSLILLFVSNVFGAGENCGVDKHCGPGEKCLKEERAKGVFRNRCFQSYPTPRRELRFCNSTWDCKWYFGESCNEYGWCTYYKYAWDQNLKKLLRSGEPCNSILDCDDWWKGDKCVDGKCVEGKLTTDPPPKPKCKTCKSRFNCKWWRLQKCVDGCCKSRKG